MDFLESMKGMGRVGGGEWYLISSSGGGVYRLQLFGAWAGRRFSIVFGDWRLYRSRHGC